MSQKSMKIVRFIPIKSSRISWCLFSYYCYSYYYLLLLLLLLFIQCVWQECYAYNLSPKPNIILKDPQLITTMTKFESSYFGFTLNLRPSGIIIGAPRAQSTLPLQRNINETGAIYRCDITMIKEKDKDKDKNINCIPYVFDDQGNRNIEYSEYTYDSEKRDFQWLGGAMDGGINDHDKLLVCAPRFVAPAPNDYLMHGLCYWINDTLSSKPINVRKISPLRLKQDQIREENGHRFYYYMLAEQGLSAHVTDNNEEFLIGAPGIHTWKGSVIRYRRRTIDDDPSLSRRDINKVLSRKIRQTLDDDVTHISYESDIPNPDKFDQSIDSYFGYSVTSGYFDSLDTKKLLYVATAPQANQQAGEAYIFDILNGNTITKYYVFRGQQFGEYFGYAVLADDLNGDGLTDVIISAPQYSQNSLYDDGAIYVFINQGRFNFERKLLTSPVKGRVRFGTTLTRLGDLNYDGYNDIAVGAPFAGNGAVFIYMGSDDGLRHQPSQRLNSPLNADINNYGVHMFGHGLSKGVDIDGNGFNDLAIGAPNSEAVCLYRAYPVVKIHATIQSQTREIKPEQTKFPVTICYQISTTSNHIDSQELTMRVVVDPTVKRVKILPTGLSVMTFNATAGFQKQCRVIDCEVRFSVADIFKPIELEIHYDLVNGVPNSEVFCEICAAVDPAEPKVFTEKIIFSTGCATEICVADMQVTATNLDHIYILGSSRTLTVNYEITNDGETAYLPQINVTSSNRMPFAKVPPNCNVANSVLLCDLNRGQPMAKGAKDSLKIIYDVSGVTGTAMILTAEVFSTGKELTPKNNILKDVITLTEFTEIEATGSPKTGHINLEKIFDTAYVINNYEIKSNGPSNVGAIELTFNIPVAYKIPGSTAIIPIIDANNITMQAVYDSQLVGIDYYQNTTQILMNSIEMSSNGISAYAAMHTTTIQTMVAAAGAGNNILNNINSLNFNNIKLNNEPDFNKGHTLGGSIEGEENTILLSNVATSRRKRLAEMAALTASKDQYARIAQTKAFDLIGDDLKGTLPVNRTIVFNCNDPEMTICIKAVMHLYNFKPEKPITITMQYKIDLKEVNQILIEPWEFFVILIGVDIIKPSDPLGKSLAITKRIVFNIISKHQLYGTPIWVIILAILGGLLALALITYGMYKAGFFKRSTKEELDKLVQQDQVSADGVTEASNLNTGNN